MNISQKFSHIKILIGEDYDMIQEIIAQFLEFLGIKNYTQVSDGQHLIDEAQANEYDLILVDLNMPLKSGLQVVNQRKTFKGSPIVIIISASTSSEVENQCRISGVDDYMRKPIEFEDIQQLLSKHFK